ncbi:MAG: hypothetical protein V2A78_05930 [bacterium]|jgi:hypothetical protein
MNDKETVVFKSEDSLWQMLRQGIKTWDARRFDTSDERIRRLSLGHWEKNPHPGRLAIYEYNEPFVCFENKLNGQVLQFRYRGFITPGWSPGWCFIQLGGLVATYNADGSETSV